MVLASPLLGVKDNIYRSGSIQEYVVRHCFPEHAGRNSKSLALRSRGDFLQARFEIVLAFGP